MGYSSWSDDAFKEVVRSRKGRSRSEIFKGPAKIHPTMNPHGLGVRESRDSDEHPDSTAIIVGFDVTGSMGDIPVRFAQEKLGGLMRMLVERKYIADPQVLFAAVGDAVVDKAPLQVGQFESGLEMDMWLTRIWLEGGGGDAPESYGLVHWFAAHHTSTDCHEKRGKKGYLFTIADASNKELDASQIARVFGTQDAEGVSVAAAVKAASAAWEVFHIYVTRGRPPQADVLADWRGLLGDRCLILANADAVCEVIGVTIGLVEGSLDEGQARADLAEAGVSKVDVDTLVKQAQGAVG